MKEIKITVIKKVLHEDLIEKYENPISNACNMEVGQTFIVHNMECPKDFCESAWQSLYPFVMTLANGGEKLYDGWMKNPQSAMVSCNDGFRPVSFYVEVIE